MILVQSSFLWNHTANNLNLHMNNLIAFFYRLSKIKDTTVVFIQGIVLNKLLPPRSDCSSKIGLIIAAIAQMWLVLIFPLKVKLQAFIALRLDHIIPPLLWDSLTRKLDKQITWWIINFLQILWQGATEHTNFGVPVTWERDRATKKLFFVNLRISSAFCLALRISIAVWSLLPRVGGEEITNSVSDGQH